MSTDLPVADLRVEEEAWDAERVAEYIADYERSWQEMRLAVVEHVPTGELVAYTELQIPAFPGIEFGFQRDTLVLREHRGHRLGMLAKAANLELLVRERPCVRRIHPERVGERVHARDQRGAGVPHGRGPGRMAEGARGIETLDDSAAVIPEPVNSDSAPESIAQDGGRGVLPSASAVA